MAFQKFPVKFDQEFIERRLREHAELQHKLYEQSVRAAVREVVIALKADDFELYRVLRKSALLRKVTARKDERRGSCRGPHPSI